MRQSKENHLFALINTFGAQIVHPRPKLYIYILSDNKTRERVENWNHQNKYSIKQWQKKEKKKEEEVERNPSNNHLTKTQKP